MAAGKSASAYSLAPGELKQRVAVIKRFKELLKAQRDRFSAYLDALDKQHDVIQRGTAEDLLHHVELEEKIVADIFSIQKVIDPLEKMYQSVGREIPREIPGKKHSGGEARLSEAMVRRAPVSGSGDEEVSGLREALEGLKAEAVIRSERNRVQLSKRMAELRSEIKSLRSNPYIRRQENTAMPTQIDIRG